MKKIAAITACVAIVAIAALHGQLVTVPGGKQAAYNANPQAFVTLDGQGTNYTLVVISNTLYATYVWQGTNNDGKPLAP